ncbi:hypothetical protein PG991_006151 [Apiospora marii]|uniref:Uncharacterized protein n=2 Tax=Apiospora marii TaxID=335849 RepID=A0ABR1SBB6_9PEZI
MSDQHLVTGTAMLITSYAIAAGAGGLDKERTVYSLRVATSLATCAAIVHIATLSVLRFRFHHRTVDSALRHFAIVVFVGLTFGARIASSFTSFEEDGQCVFKSRVSRGFAGMTETDRIRVTATAMEMVGLWVCLYRSLKSCLHIGGLRSVVRFCLRKIRGDWQMSLSRRQSSSPLLTMVVEFSESSLIDMLWLSLFFCYSLAEIGRIYAGRVKFGTAVVVEPSFGQLMPMLVLTGSLLGVLTTWKGM